MSLPKKNNHKKSARSLGVVHTQETVMTRAKKLTKFHVLAFMFSHKLVVPQIMTLTFKELIEAIGFYIEHHDTDITWDSVNDGLDEADNMQNESIQRWKAVVSSLSDLHCDKLVKVVFPLLAKWKLAIVCGWASVRHVNSFEPDPSWVRDVYILNNRFYLSDFTRISKNRHILIHNNTYSLCVDEEREMMSLNISPVVLETTDKNAELFRTLNIKTVSKRPLVIPPLLVSLVLVYTRRLLLDDC